MFLPPVENMNYSSAFADMRGSRCTEYGGSHLMESEESQQNTLSKRWVRLMFNNKFVITEVGCFILIHFPGYERQRSQLLDSQYNDKRACVGYFLQT